jgi:hypothetical protein
MENKLLGKFFCLLMLLMVVSISIDAQSLNQNGGFEETSIGQKQDTAIAYWDLIVGTDASAYFYVEDSVVHGGNRALSVEVTKVAINAYDVQAVNEPFKVAPNTTYKYSIWAKADKVGPIVDFTVGDYSYYEWGRAGQVAMTTDWQQVTFNFTTPANAPDSGRAPIHFAEPANAIFGDVRYYVDDLQISASITDVLNKQIPNNFYLSQNYPNPFNPATIISYSIPKFTYVSLIVYNIFGQKVAILYKGFQNAGTYKVNFNGTRLASGTYFCRFEADKFIDTKKLILLK